MRFLIPIGMAVGFIWEIGSNIYAQSHMHGGQRMGGDILWIYAFTGVFWGGVLGAIVRKIINEVNQRRAMQAAEQARLMHEAQKRQLGVWPPPPISPPAEERNP